MELSARLQVGVFALGVLLSVSYLVSITKKVVQTCRTGGGWIGTGALITVEATGCTVAVGGALAGSRLVYFWFSAVSPSVHILAQVAGALIASSAFTSAYDRWFAGPISAWFFFREAGDEDGQVAPAAVLGYRARHHDEPRDKGLSVLCATNGTGSGCSSRDPGQGQGDSGDDQSGSRQAGGP